MKKDVHNSNAFLLCLVGGILMILAGVSGSLQLMGELLMSNEDVMDPTALMTVEIVTGMLVLLTALGGLGVVASGIILTTRRVHLGRILVALFTGMGVLGLAANLAQLVMVGTLAMDLMHQVGQSLGWIGAMFAIIARTVAVQKPIVE
ncbi:MAG: hypothetical protein KAW94_01230 [Candidatus Thorarchaeota archaeon]|nr:hypothetical protein [Candidatus Thorarchaeota archaeon]